MLKRKPGPTLRAQWLGQQLRALRESTGMTLRQAGDYLQRDPSMVSRFETAEYPIRRGDVLALLDLYGVSEERTRDGLLQLSDDVWRKGWWDDYASVVGRRYIDLVWLESRAQRLCTYEAMLVPGLLQTREYAETLIRNAAARRCRTAQCRGPGATAAPRRARRFGGCILALRDARSLPRPGLRE